MGVFRSYRRRPKSLWSFSSVLRWGCAASTALALALLRASGMAEKEKWRVDSPVQNNCGGCRPQKSERTGLKTRHYKGKGGKCLDLFAEALDVFGTFL
jgi:hypothetical protein